MKTQFRNFKPLNRQRIDENGLRDEIQSGLSSIS